MIPGALGTCLRCPLTYVSHAAQGMSTTALQGGEAPAQSYTTSKRVYWAILLP